MFPRSLRARRALVLAALATAAGVAATAPDASAATKTWQGAGGGSWTNGALWSGGTSPNFNDDAYLGTYSMPGTTDVLVTLNTSYLSPGLGSIRINSTGIGGTFTLSQTSNVSVLVGTEIVGDTISGNLFNQSAGNDTVTGLTLGNQVGGNGTYSLSGTGILNVANFTVGNAGSGTYNQSAGTLNVSGHMVMGNGATFGNFVNLSGGTVNFTSAGADLTIGNGTGSAVFGQTGGTVNAANSTIDIADSGSSLGTYALSGAGTLNAGTVNVGTGNSGTFNQSGGTAKVDKLYLAPNVSTSAGTYNLSGASASLTTSTTYVGYYGRGTFNQSGGAHTTNYLDVGSGANAAGVYNLSGGTLSLVPDANSSLGTIALGSASTSATFNQTGGTLNGAASQVWVGANANGVGTYNLKGGTATLSTVQVGFSYFGSGGRGTFTQSGGTLTVSDVFGGLYVGNSNASTGYYHLTSDNGPATLNSSYEVIGGGADARFLQEAGTTNTVSGALLLGTGGVAGATAKYTMWGGALTVAQLSVLAGGQFQHDGYDATVTVTNALRIDPNQASYPGATAGYTLSYGTLNVPAGSGAYVGPGGTFAQYSGGTFTGTLSNSGTFAYYGGSFNGLLDNGPAGTLTLSGNSLTAGKGLINRGTIALGTNDAIGTGAGYTLDNQAVLTLAGGSLGGAGALANNATLSGWGTIGGVGGFTNNDTLAQGAGTLLISNTGTNVNNGAMFLAAGRQVQVATNLTNAGSLAVGSALVTGAGSLTNNASGLMVGPGTISVAGFSNAGTLLAPAGTTRVTPNFTNSGLIQLNDIAASITGGTISNTGSIQGTGKIASAITNPGTITPGAGGTLTLAGPLTNTGLLMVPANAKLLVTGAFASNTGTITLGGGTFDTNNQALTNAGIITGYGVVSTGGLTNNASITFTGGNTTVTGPVTNGAGKTIEVRFNPALFTGAVVNNGTIKVTGTTATFAGSYAGTPPSEAGGVALDGGAQGPGMSAGNDGGLTGPGGVVVDPGATVVASYVRQSSLVATSGTVLTRPSAAGGQASVLNTLVLTGSASFDLADNNLIWDASDAAGVSTATGTLRGYLFAGNVTSSIAAGDQQHRMGIGYATSAELGVTSWGGQAVDSTAVLTKMTYLGDANLDGVVNADDYALLDRGLARHLSTWTGGDFNYDGQVTSADYLLIDRVYFQQGVPLSPDFLAMREAEFGPAYVSALVASVPEPSAVLGYVIAGLPVAARRRRRG